MKDLEKHDPPTFPRAVTCSQIFGDGSIGSAENIGPLRRTKSENAGVESFHMPL